MRTKQLWASMREWHYHTIGKINGHFEYKNNRLEQTSGPESALRFFPFDAAIFQGEKTEHGEIKSL